MPFGIAWMLAALLGLVLQPGAPAARPEPGALRPEAPATVADASTPRHLMRLRQLLSEIETTDYQHRPTIVRWKSPDAPATCRTDCSGLINELLKDAYGLTRADLKDWFGRERPLAIHYQRTIEAGKHFEIISRISAIEPGDILAIKYPPDSDNSGHVVVVDQRPEEAEAMPPVVEGLAQWTLRVIDSSSLGHGPGDSRLDKAGKYHPGLGVGVMRLYVKPDGTIAGYASSVDEKARFHTIQERPLSVGRVRTETLGEPSRQEGKP